MISRELYSYIKQGNSWCDVYDNSAILVGLESKSKILKMLRTKYTDYNFIEERVSSEEKIIIRAIPKRFTLML